MNAKEFLKQCSKLDKMIENKLAEKAQWMAIATSTTANMSGERVQTSGNQQKMADAVHRCVDIEREIDACVDKLIHAKREIIAVIEQLSVTEYDILHKIYVQYKTLNDVADIYNNSYSWATTIHGRALKNVQRILDGEKRNE